MSPSDLSAFWTAEGPFPLCADICSSAVLLSLSSSPLHFVIAFCFVGLLHPSPCSFPSTSPLQGFLCMNLANTGGRERTAIALLLLLGSPHSCMLGLSYFRSQAAYSFCLRREKCYEDLLLFSSSCAADILGYSEFDLCGFSHPGWSCGKINS